MISFLIYHIVNILLILLIFLGFNSIKTDDKELVENMANTTGLQSFGQEIIMLSILLIIYWGRFGGVGTETSLEQKIFAGIIIYEIFIKIIFSIFRQPVVEWLQSLDIQKVKWIKLPVVLETIFFGYLFIKPYVELFWHMLLI